MKKKNAFTLIELVAVLVIMAVIALIAIPLILTLVNNSKASANKRSVDAYGKAVELAALSYLMDDGEYPSDLSTLTVEYTGKEVACNVMTLNNDGSLYLSECSVGGTEVKDKNTEDGWYHYGKQGESASSYQAYNVGDTVSYNGIEFYVISPSDETSDSVTLLKAEPLTVDEVNTYGVGHINNYAYGSVGTAFDYNGYGGMAYYSSATCGYARPGDDEAYIREGCTSDYESSEVKYVVDGWSSDKLNTSDLKVDETGYSARLITIEELTTNLGYDSSLTEDYYIAPSTNGETPSWVYKSNYDYYYYWTMSHFNNSSYVWDVSYQGRLYYRSVYHGTYEDGNVVRPVINLYKSAIK